jgi:hypothetical protein
MQKIARRAIEAELHKRCERDPAPVSPAVRLLSSAPPCPVSHTFKFDKGEVASSVYQVIAEQYRQWLTRQSEVELTVKAVTA